MPRVILDTNIILYILNNDERTPQIMEIIFKYSQCCISSITYTTVWYFIEKWKLDFREAKSCLDTFEILSTSSEDCELGFDLAKNEDVEDGVQIAIALNNGISNFVTCDKGLYEKYCNNLNIILIP